MNRAVFLDRDGVINRKAPRGKYVTQWKDWHFLDGIAPAVRLLNQANFRVIVVTNQRCIAKGLLTLRGLGLIHRKMIHALASAGARIDAVYFCPHEKHPPCSCRKPAPGLLLRAAIAHDIDLAASWMVGDSSGDIIAGRNAGCRTVRICSGRKSKRPAADISATSLLRAVKKILSREGKSKARRLPRRRRVTPRH